MKVIFRFVIGWALIWSASVCFAQEKFCEDLRSFFAKPQSDTAQLQKNLDDLAGRITANADCAKNLLGRIYFEGINITKDEERAHAIFYELANKGYPPAQFNLAYFLQARGTEDPKVVLGLLQGIVASYVGTPDYGYLALRARDLGREYVQNQRGAKRDADSSLDNAYDEFEWVVRNSTTQAGIQMRNKAVEEKERAEAPFNAIMSILAIGVAVGAVTSRVAASRAVTNVRIPSPHIVVGFLNGEQQSGVNKVCFYNVAGSSYTANVGVAELCPLTVNAPIPAPMPNYGQPSPSGKTGILKGEQTSGVNKVCLYDVAGSTYSLTVNAAAICPLTNQF